MRVTIKRLLEADPEIQVVGLARDGMEALEKINTLKPDVVTLDIDMPLMDGLETLRIIMEERPLPVLMLSSLTQEGAVQTLRALEMGAVDFIPKRAQQVNTGIIGMREVLIQKVKACAVSHPVPKTSKRIVGPLHKKHWADAGFDNAFQVVAIGASTGGPSALTEVIPYLPEDFPAAVLVVQHMPIGYTRAFADRLNKASRIPVKEAEEGDEVVPGRVLIAPAGEHLSVRRSREGKGVIRLSMEPESSSHRPSVDVMMCSAAEVYGDHMVGILMTGMGCDGMEGMKTIKQNRGKTMAQDKETCVVYGMPRSAIEIGVVDQIVPLCQISESIVDCIEAEWERDIQKRRLTVP
ncbi:MAG: chemotaxis response regulator protein-glutamate methylesterase [bacterium]